MKDIRAIYAKEGFYLTKFAINSKYVSLSIPKWERRKGLPDYQLRLETLLTEKAPGILWNIEEDKLVFNVHFKNKPYTKRGTLSMVS